MLVKKKTNLHYTNANYYFMEIRKKHNYELLSTAVHSSQATVPGRLVWWVGPDWMPMHTKPLYRFPSSVGQGEENRTKSAWVE